MPIYETLVIDRKKRRRSLQLSPQGANLPEATQAETQNSEPFAVHLPRSLA